MQTFLMIVLLLVSIFLIISVLMQSSSSDGLSGSIAGGAEQLFGKKRSTPIEEFMRKATIVAAILFIVLSLAIVTLFT